MVTMIFYIIHTFNIRLHSIGIDNWAIEKGAAMARNPSTWLSKVSSPYLPMDESKAKAIGLRLLLISVSGDVYSY